MGGKTLPPHAENSPPLISEKRSVQKAFRCVFYMKGGVLDLHNTGRVFSAFSELRLPPMLDGQSQRVDTPA